MAGLIAAILVPVVVVVVGVHVMQVIAGSRHCKTLRKSLSKPDRVPLHERYRGYDVAAVDRHWGPIEDDEHAIMCETRLLKLDLLFPFIYCLAFGISFIILSVVAAHPITFILGVAFLVVLATLVSDVIENLILLSQLRHYVETGSESLSVGGIRAASTATKLKFGFFAATMVIILLTCVAILFGL